MVTCNRPECKSGPCCVNAPGQQDCHLRNPIPPEINDDYKKYKKAEAEAEALNPCDQKTSSLKNLEEAIQKYSEALKLRNDWDNKYLTETCNNKHGTHHCLPGGSCHLGHKLEMKQKIDMCKAVLRAKELTEKQKEATKERDAVPEVEEFVDAMGDSWKSKDDYNYAKQQSVKGRTGKDYEAKVNALNELRSRGLLNINDEEFDYITGWDVYPKNDNKFKKIIENAVKLNNYLIGGIQRSDKLDDYIESMLTTDREDKNLNPFREENFFTKSALVQFESSKENKKKISAKKSSVSTRRNKAAAALASVAASSKTTKRQGGRTLKKYKKQIKKTKKNKYKKQIKGKNSKVRKTRKI